MWMSSQRYYLKDFFFSNCNMTKFVFLLGLLELVLGGDYSVTKYKFLGLRNVWHTGTQNHIERYVVENLPRYLPII